MKMSESASNVYAQITRIINSDKGVSLKKAALEKIIASEGFDINALFEENQEQFTGYLDASWSYNPKKVTPLIYAISRKQPEIVELFLQKGARINVPDSEGQLPLEEALLYAPTVTAYTGASEEHNIKTSKVVSLVIGKLESKEINQLYPLPMGRFCTEQRFTTPLMSAISRGCMVAIDCLLEKKADVNVETENNPNNPLSAAIGSNNLEIVQKIIASGAVLTKLCRDWSGKEYENALELVKSNKNLKSEIRDLITSAFAGPSPEKKSKSDNRFVSEEISLRSSSAENEVIAAMRARIQALESEVRTLRLENKQLKEKLEAPSQPRSGVTASASGF